MADFRMVGDDPPGMGEQRPQAISDPVERIGPQAPTVERIPGNFADAIARSQQDGQSTPTGGFDPWAASRERYAEMTGGASPVPSGSLESLMTALRGMNGMGGDMGAERHAAMNRTGIPGGSGVPNFDGGPGGAMSMQGRAFQAALGRPRTNDGGLPATGKLPMALDGGGNFAGALAQLQGNGQAMQGAPAGNFSNALGRLQGDGGVMGNMGQAPNRQALARLLMQSSRRGRRF